MSHNGDESDRPLWVVGARRYPPGRPPRTVGKPPRIGPGGPGGIRSYLLAGLALLLFVAVVRGIALAAEVHVNIWWFESLKLGSVYGQIWTTEKNLFLIFFAITYLWLTAIYVVARILFFGPGTDANARAAGALAAPAAGLLAVFASLTVGLAMAGQWQQYLLAAHAQSFGRTDPIHHRDIGFYVFSLPWRETLGNVTLTLLILGGVGLAALTLLFSGTSPRQTLASDIRRAVGIGCLFAAVLFLSLAWRNLFLLPYYLNGAGTVYGGGATFVHSSLWWYTVVAVVEIVTALVLLVNVALRLPGLATVAFLPLIVGLAASAGQGIFQHFVVAPNELSAEYRYLGYTLQNTRHAYGIDRWGVREYTPRAVTASDVAASAATVRDTRVADTGAFTQVLRGRQENRTYYTFNTADIDRYSIHGQSRQVLLAGREVDTNRLPAQAQTWVNTHIKFTHGYGLTMSPANQVTPDGQPVLWIQNVPVQETVTGLPPVTQPRIYFGEYTQDWALVGATTPEFDSSSADRDTSYRYAGPDGVPIGSGLRRLTLSWIEEGGFPFFNKLNISNYVRPTTRILLHRDIMDRVQRIAPWLTLDGDPYLVLRRDGSLVWMLDGVTSTDRYPYSDPTNGVNYERNSVKIALDAYTGRPIFYAFDPSDPILRAWSAAFPGLIHPFTQMPADLRRHIKYPDTFLNWQADGYRRYHVTDITSYYNGDNQWDIESSSTYNWNDQQVEQNTLDPIWTVARLFGEKHDAFFSILPFSVRGKATMAGYLAANNNTYRVTALDMPRGAQTTGVTQFESLYNQAPTISTRLSLLDQHGSQVLPGQGVVLPVGRSLLYIKPLYLRSNTSQSLPQLVRVVVGSQNEVNWGYGVNDALNNLLAQGDISNVNSVAPSAPTPQPPSVAPPASGNLGRLSDAQLIALADSEYAAAQNTPSLTAKDRDLRQVGAILAELHRRHPH